MTANEDVHALESDLAESRQDLKETIARIDDKVQTAKAQLNPKHAAGEHIEAIAAIAAGLCAIIGLWLWARREPAVAEPQPLKVPGRLVRDPVRRVEHGRAQRRA
jgi:hypothetical protein